MKWAAAGSASAGTPSCAAPTRPAAAPTATTNSTIAARRASPAPACTTCSFRTSGGWRARLTLTLGLRTENEKIPTFRRDIKDYGFEFGFADKIAPAPRRQLRRARRRPRQAVWKLGPVLRLGEVRTLPRHLRRRHLARILPLAGYPRTCSTCSRTPASPTCPAATSGRIAPSSFRDRRVPSFDLVAKDIKPMSQDNMNFGR